MEEDQEAALVNRYIRNGLPSTSPASTVPSPSERKRKASALDDHAIKKSRSDRDSSAQASKNSKVPASKLQRPKKTRQQTSTSSRPTKAKEDIYEVPTDANEENASASKKSKEAARRRVGRPKGWTRSVAAQHVDAANSSIILDISQRRQQAAPGSGISFVNGVKSPQQRHEIQPKMKLLSGKTRINNPKESEEEEAGDETEHEDLLLPTEEYSDAEAEDDQAPSQEVGSPWRNSNGLDQDQVTAGVAAPHEENEIDGARQANGTEQRPRDNSKMLLGHDHIWSIILKFVRSNRRAAAQDKTIMTNTVKELVSTIKIAQRLYKEVDEGNQQNGPVADLEEEIDVCLNELDELVMDLSAGDAQKRLGEIVKDVYLHAAPQCITLLKYAMRCRELEDSKKAYNLDGLREIVRIQDITVLLCSKVAAWGVKPVTKAAITRNVKQRIFPYLREMAITFKKKLKQEEVWERRRENEKQYATQRPESETPSPELRARRTAEREIENRRILESMEEESRKLKRYRRLRAEGSAPSSHASQTRQSQTPALTQEARTQNTNLSQQPERIWTAQKDKALVDQLLNNIQTRNLPCKSRKPSHATWSSLIS